MMATPPRKINMLLRVMMSAVLVAFALFVAQYKKSIAPPKPAAPVSTKPFLSKAPSSEGSNHFAWIPSYPGATVENITTKQTHDQLSYGYNFRTADDFKQVLAFYGERLQSAGFKAEINNSGERGGDLHAAMDASGRSFDAIAAKVLQGTGTEVGITAVQR
jgi:hypothetical protein